MSGEQVLVVDDHPLFASAVVDILTGLNETAQIHTVSSFTAARDYVRDQGVPKLVLLDLNLPDSPASQSLKNYAEVFAGAQVVVFSGMDDDVRVRQALAGGAIGFISKAQRPAEIMSSLTRLLAGQPVAPHVPSAQASAQELPLSPRQAEVMEAITSGLSNKEIARELGMSPGTVKVHVREIFSRLGARNRVEAIALYNDLASTQH